MRTEPAGEGVDRRTADALIQRARRVFGGLSLFWLLGLGLSLGLDAPVEGGPPMWMARGVLLAILGMCLVPALGLKPGAKGAWSVGVLAAGLSMFNCLALPMSVWALALLFRKAMLAEVLGGGWARAQDPR